VLEGFASEGVETGEKAGTCRVLSCRKRSTCSGERAPSRTSQFPSATCEGKDRTRSCHCSASSSDSIPRAEASPRMKTASFGESLSGRSFAMCAYPSGYTHEAPGTACNPNLSVLDHIRCPNSSANGPVSSAHLWGRLLSPHSLPDTARVRFPSCAGMQHIPFSRSWSCRKREHGPLHDRAQGARRFRFVLLHVAFRRVVDAARKVTRIRPQFRPALDGLRSF